MDGGWSLVAQRAPCVSGEDMPVCSAELVWGSSTSVVVSLGFLDKTKA